MIPRLLSKGGSIARRVTWMNVLVSALALLLACIGFVIYDQITVRRAIANTLVAQSQIVGANSASALMFDDPAAAAATLSPLRNTPNMIAAVIRLPAGNTFAVLYPNSESVLRPFVLAPNQREMHWSAGGNLVYAREIRFAGRTLGSVVLASNLSGATARLRRYLAIALVVFAFSLALAILLSRGLRALISGPIERLADAARQVSRERDFSLRVAPGGETGEVAILVDAFNEMLQELHAHEMERKRAEDALIQSEKLAATGRMAATIAHEINNPLASITNVVHLLRARARARGGDDLQEAELLNILNEEVVRVSHIVKSTLGIARQSAVPTSANLADLADDVLTLFERRFIARNISVTRRYGPNPEALVVSSDVRQVISNLVGNALDVLPNAGALLIAVHHSFDWRDPSRHGVRISVSDNGPGIPPDVRHRLFQPFFTTKAEMGTGLGLWVSRSMIEKAGGSIRFKSSTSGPHTGTCFSVFLPSHRENIDQQKGVA